MRIVAYRNRGGGLYTQPGKPWCERNRQFRGGKLRVVTWTTAKGAIMDDPPLRRPVDVYVSGWRIRAKTSAGGRCRIFAWVKVDLAVSVSGLIVVSMLSGF